MAGDDLSKEEAAIYDRQIRLWGVEAQQRLRKARVLVAGACGLGNEIVKNILLAGIKHLTLLDHRDVTQEQVSGQFLASHDSIGQKRVTSSLQRARQLNPMVDIFTDTEKIEDKSEEFFNNFDVVCVVGESRNIQLKINDVCRRHDTKFLSGNVFGYYGYSFEDFGRHEFVEEKVKVIEHKKGDEPSAKKQKTSDEVEMVEMVADFCSLKDALAHNYSSGMSLRNMKQLSKAYLVMHVMHAYSDKHGCHPSKLHSNRTAEELSDLRNEVLERLHLDADMLPDTFTSLCVGELFPVNAIVGGVMAQEIIKAVSGRDAPHNNFLFYDGDASSGVVLKVAPPAQIANEKSSATAVPAKSSAQGTEKVAAAADVASSKSEAILL